MLTVSIIGAGRVGGAIAIALDRTGYNIKSLVYRGDRFVPLLRRSLPSAGFHHSSDPFSTDTDVLIIASGDPEIRGIAESVSFAPKLPKFAFHTSGSLSSEELDPLRAAGVHTASLHPLAAVSDPAGGPDRFRGSFFCIEGDTEAIEIGRRIAEDLGGQPFSIPTASIPLYHAAAVMSAGHIVALLDAAIEVMGHCGLSADAARRVLVPLAGGSVANLSERTPSEALTGPFARGDASALERHLAALASAEANDELRQIYLDLALRSVEIAIEGGRDYQTLRESILMAKRKSQ